MNFFQMGYHSNFGKTETPLITTNQSVIEMRINMFIRLLVKKKPLYVLETNKPGKY